MIAKTIHYCWFGRGPLPPLAIKCKKSWKEFFPDYEIIEWNEDNFDVNIIRYTAEAYKAGKYAFVSDYARFWILYHYGGLYFDTDVEIIKSMDDIIERGPFMGCERYSDSSGQKGALSLGVAPGLGLGVTPGLGLYKKMLDIYESLDFAYEYDKNRTIVYYMTEMLVAEGLKNTDQIQQVAGVYIYPKDYFCPINQTTRRLHITNNTRSIHHYVGSWENKRKNLKVLIQPYIPEKLLLMWHNFKNRRNGQSSNID